MNGQLWQPCSRCDEEPCCVDCERCERHCTCAQEQRDAAQIAAFEQRFPGVLHQLETHHEQGAQEH